MVFVFVGSDGYTWCSFHKGWYITAKQNSITVGFQQTWDGGPTRKWIDFKSMSIILCYSSTWHWLVPLRLKLCKLYEGIMHFADLYFIRYFYNINTQFIVSCFDEFCQWYPNDTAINVKSAFLHKISKYQFLFLEIEGFESFIF